MRWLRRTKRVYVVVGLSYNNSNNHEDHHQRILGVYATEEAAERNVPEADDEGEAWVEEWGVER